MLPSEPQIDRPHSCQSRPSGDRWVVIRYFYQGWAGGGLFSRYWSKFVIIPSFRWPRWNLKRLILDLTLTIVSGTLRKLPARLCSFYRASACPACSSQAPRCSPGMSNSTDPIFCFAHLQPLGSSNTANYSPSYWFLRSLNLKLCKRK